MEPNGESLDLASIAALVVRVIDDIDSTSDAGRATLLEDLLCAAWGSPQAQSQ